jgi:hypothetical protein
MKEKKRSLGLSTFFAGAMRAVDQGESVFSMFKSELAPQDEGLEQLKLELGVQLEQARCG